MATDRQSIEEAVLDDLRDRGRLTAVTEAQASQYAHAVVQVERLTGVLDELTPGSPEYKRASTALRGAARERDTLSRQLGQTEQARRADKIKAEPRALHELFRVPERTEEERAEVMRRLRARIVLDEARVVAEWSQGTPFEEKNAELLRDAERDHGWVDDVA